MDLCPARARDWLGGAVLNLRPEDFPPRRIGPEAELELALRTGVVEVKTQPSYSAVGGVYSNQPTMIVVPLDAPTFPKLSRFDGLQPLGD